MPDNELRFYLNKYYYSSTFIQHSTPKPPVMKKVLLIVPLELMLTFSSVFSQSQQTLYTMEDAGKLESLFLENEKAVSSSQKSIENVRAFFGLFKKYGNYDTLKEEILLRENPFLSKDIIIKLPPVKGGDTSLKEQKIDDYLGLAEAIEVSAESSGTGGGVSWQTAILDGTARFLARRFKDELAAYYLSNFYSKLNDKPVVKSLFPKTVEFLKVFAYQVYNTDIATLQAAAEEDINNFTENLIPTLDYFEGIKREPLFKSGLSLSLDVYNDLKNGVNVAEIINTMPAKEYLLEPYKSMLTLLKILSNSLRNSSPDVYDGPWSDIDGYNLLNKEDKQITFYYALLYEQLKGIRINNKTIKDCIGSGREQWEEWFKAIVSFHQKLSALNALLTSQKKTGGSMSPDFWETLSRSSNVINEIFPVINKIPGGKIIVPAAVTNVSRNVKSLFYIIKLVNTKKYTQVIPEIMMLLTGLDSSIKNEQLVPYMRYASVLAQFAQVKTPDEMKELLESVALPIGSASIKRKSKWNIAINTYVGVAAGTEEARGNQFRQTKTSIGLSAPIGIAISKRYASKRGSTNGGKESLIPSGTLYLSFFDIGNLVNVRLKSDTASIGDVKFSHFFSLGAGYFFNFRSSPFSAGFSWTYVPQYRDFKTGNQWINKADAIRIRFSLLVDIPITNLYTKPSD
jgi:hypothetical protein